MSQREETELLFQRSNEFRKTAGYQIKAGFFGLAVFSLEQSLELFLKAQLLLRGVDYPRTHSVRTLIEILIELGIEEEKKIFQQLLRKYLLELGTLEDAYITSRYILREFSKKEAMRLEKVVNEVIEKCPTEH